MANIDELLNQALAIRDAEQDAENTAWRVGTLLIGLVQSLQGMLPADEFEAAMEAMLPELSSLFAGISQGSVNRLQRGVIVLKSMGSTLDNVDGGNYSPTCEAGDILFTGTALRLFTANGAEDYTIRPTAFYLNAHTLRLYKWDGSAMVELGNDITKPVIIDYLTPIPFASMAIGAVYYLDTDHKLHMKTGASTQVPLPVNPNCIYCDRSSGNVVIWDAGTSTWKQVGGGSVLKNVTFDNGNLIFTFKTATGEQVVSVPLSFDPSNYVPTSRTVNSKPLSANITIGMSDIPGLLDAIANAGSGAVSVSTNQDGTFTIHVGSEDYIIDLNHEHPDYQPLLTSANAGTNITIMTDPQTGEVTISAAGGGGGGGTQVQADWNQADRTAVDYIKNKPTIPVVPTVVSAFTNDAGYLTQHQSLAGRVQSQDVVSIVKITQSDYDALSVKDSTTLYLITES